MKTYLANRLSMIMIMAAFCFFNAYGQGQSTNADTTLVDELYKKSKNYWGKQQDSALYYLQQVEALSEKMNYKRGEAYALYGYGVVEKVLYKQFQYFTQSLEIFEAEHDAFGIGLNLVKIGYIYEQIGQREKAFEYYNQALVVKKEVNDYGGIALALINIGHYYKGKGKFNEELKYYEEALIYRIKEGTLQGKAFAQVNMGEALFSLNEIERALVMTDSAIANFTLAANLNGQVWSLSLKGKCLLAMKKSKEAQEIFERIISYSERTSYLSTILSAKRLLINMYSEKGELKKAFDLQSEYVIAMDTLANRDYRAETQRIVNEYEFKVLAQKAEQERILQAQQIARRNNLEYLSIAIIVLLIFIVLFSRGKKLSVKFLNVTLLIGLLLLFEFLLILTDSSVDKITGGEPILKLLANVVMALFILPGHQFLERYSRKKLIRDEVIS